MSSFPWVWLNQRLVRREKAKISAFDRGFLFGDGAFETLRVYGGHPFDWMAHERRLRRTLRLLRFRVDFEGLRPATQALLRKNRAEDAALRITISRGEGEPLLPGGQPHPTVLLSLRELPENLAARQARGESLGTLAFGPAVGSPSLGKLTSYAPSVLGAIVTRRIGTDHGIFVSPDGVVSETATSNLFLVARDRLLTPALDSGCLPGVTRARVLRLARAMGIKIEQRRLTLGHLAKADEIFLTSSLIEILPIRRFNGHPIGLGTPGPVTLRLQQGYKRQVRRWLATREQSS